MSTLYQAFFSAHIFFAQFWPQISQGFHDTPMLSTGFMVLGIVLGIVLLFILGYILFLRLWPSTDPEDSNPFKVASPEKIQEILDTAWAQSNRLELYFRTRGQHLSCLIQELSRDSLVIEPPQHIKPRQGWLNRRVIVFFTVRIDRQKRVYYKFESSITGFPLINNVPMLELAVPDVLSMEQKRVHLRLEPPLAYIKCMRLWRVLHNKDGSLPRDIASRAEPLAQYTASEGKPVLKLADLSGGGLRIGIAKSLLGSMEEFIKENPSLIIFLQLRDKPDQDSQVNTYYLVGRIKNYFTDQHGYYILGMQYEYSARLDPDTGDIVRWEKVDPEEGVEGVVNWVVQKHLQFYREKGVPD